MSAIFGSSKLPISEEPEEIDPSEDALQLRRRIAQRGGEQSTILTGRNPLGATRGASAQGNIFKRNLGGTSRATR